MCVVQHAWPPARLGPATQAPRQELRMSSVVVEVLWDHPETATQPPEPAWTVFLRKTIKKGHMGETNQWGRPGWEVLSSSQDDTTTHSGRSLPPDGRSPRSQPLPESQ